jgi:hypothetical protein
LRHLVAAAIGLQPAFEPEPGDIAMDQSQAVSGPFLAAIQQHLHADADTEQRLGRRRLQDGFQQAGLAQFAHAIGHGTLPGSTTRSAARTCSGLDVTMASKPLPCATCWTACDTERRLPMP